jgi:hypothetical protein
MNEQARDYFISAPQIASPIFQAPQTSSHSSYSIHPFDPSIEDEKGGHGAPLVMGRATMVNTI